MIFFLISDTFYQFQIGVNFKNQIVNASLSSELILKVDFPIFQIYYNHDNRPTLQISA